MRYTVSLSEKELKDLINDGTEAATIPNPTEGLPPGTTPLA